MNPLYLDIGWIALVGLFEGLTPCAHSWPVVVPYAVGAHKVRKAMTAAGCFVAGKILAAAVVGSLLGGSHHVLPEGLEQVLRLAAVVLVFGLAGVLLVRPDALHLHRHCCEEHPGGEEVPHDHRPGHVDELSHPQGGEHYHDSLPLRWGAYGVMFAAGAGTMFIPGPVWGYAVTLAQASGSWLRGAVLFEVHAAASGLVVLVIAYVLARYAWAVRVLGDRRREALLVRITSAAVILGMAIHLLIPEG